MLSFFTPRDRPRLSSLPCHCSLVLEHANIYYLQRIRYFIEEILLRLEVFTGEGRGSFPGQGLIKRLLRLRVLLSGSSSHELADFA